MQSKRLAVLAVGTIVALAAAGCAKGADQSSSTSTTTTTAAAPAAAPAGSATTASKMSGSAQGDAVHGRSVFTTNCASCHGANGVEGGVGPSLKNEKSRKNYAQTVAWIKNPQPPMPKLYPDTIADKAVADVAAYVQSL